MVCCIMRRRFKWEIKKLGIDDKMCWQNFGNIFSVVFCSFPRTQNNFQLLNEKPLLSVYDSSL